MRLFRAPLSGEPFRLLLDEPAAECRRSRAVALKAAEALLCPLVRRARVPYSLHEVGQEHFIMRSMFGELAAAGDERGQRRLEGSLLS